MSKKLYTLLVGIEDYPAPVSKLYGCISDVNHLHDYLKENFNRNLYIEILKNSDASRDNIIKLFREHLGKANENDVVLFHYSGHGSRELSAPQFKEFFPDEKDETLVCYDSRKPGGFDLADKELAVLLWEVAQNNPHLAVSLDCCHSGSGTRNADDFNLGRTRQTLEWQPGTPRPIETYLEGYYKDMETIRIPRSKHVLMAACDRTETAKETRDHRGVFSTALLDVLTKSGPGISYADLFVRCRAAILKQALNQTPQFETYQHFMPYAKFLDGERLGSASRYHVYFKDNEWKMDCGALHGLPTEPDKNVEVALSPFSPGELSRDSAGFGKTISVGAQDSILKLDFDARPDAHYKAEIISLPVPPVPVYLEGDETTKSVIKEALPPGINAAFVDERQTARYVISAQQEELLLQNREAGSLLQGAHGDPQECAKHIYAVLEKVIRWERTLALQNHNTSFNPGDLQLKLFEMIEDGSEVKHEGSEITLDLVKKDDQWKVIRAKVRARNLTGQTLHLALVYLSEKYGIYILKNDPIPSGNDFVTLWGEGEEDYFHLPENVNEALDTFKLIVSTEPVDNFLLVQEDLHMGEIVSARDHRAIGTVKPVKKLITNDWFTKTLKVRTFRQLHRVSETEISLANGQITIKGHPSFKANLNMAGGTSHTRSTDHNIISRVLAGEGMEWLGFSSGRGQEENFLELSAIANEEGLKENPLEIVLGTKLEEDEYVLPLTFDGTHFLPVGYPSIDENQKVSILIDSIPDITDEKRRSLGKALKLCFFKLILRRKDLDQLCWVEFQPDGEILRHPEGVKEKIKKADNIILLVHGIIGDTESIAKGLKLAKGKGSGSIADQYDLVLTYDYENLNTPIQETARHLKAQLKEVGLHEYQDKKITILAHSMGGLVSRWFIEKEGGSKIVKHLVMAGTPNNGSAFGSFPEYRNLASTALAISLNFLKPLIPFASALLVGLNQSKKITHTLEQMNEKSGFIRELNLSSDPNVKYTILSGDITDYEVDQEGFFSRLMEKMVTGLGMLVYRDQPNDIAVSAESIKRVDDFRQPKPMKIDLVCHHLNYFQEEVSLNALAKVLI
jgi:pimeloyl-ACP methyl ester carboxylesterase